MVAAENWLPSRAILTLEQLADIGCVAVESAYCDSAVERIIWAFLGLPEERGKLVTKNMLTDRKLELLSEMGKQQLGPSHTRIDEFTALIGALKESNRKRNIAIHGIWEGEGRMSVRDWLSNPSEWPAAKAEKRRVKMDPAVMLATEVSQISRDINHQTRSLWSFIDREWPDLWHSY